MTYEIELRPRVLKDLRALSAQNQKRVLNGIEKLRENLAGDVKHLTDVTPEYRLRVGDYRVLFEVEKHEVEENEEKREVSVVVIHRIRPRDEAYN